MALTTQVDNYPGFDETVDGFTLGEKMQKAAERFGAKTVIAEVDGVHLQGSEKTIHTNEGIFAAKTVILAMGANPKKLGLPDEKRMDRQRITTIVQPAMECFIKAKRSLLWVAATVRRQMHCYYPESVRK